jgi:chromosome transmission fidelity protein 18
VPSKDKQAPPEISNVKRDFFGRVIQDTARPLQDINGNSGTRKSKAADAGKAKDKVWVTFHEGLNNAVKKPISLEEFLRGL